MQIKLFSIAIKCKTPFIYFSETIFSTGIHTSSTPSQSRNTNMPLGIRCIQLEILSAHSGLFEHIFISIHTKQKMANISYKLHIITQISLCSMKYTSRKTLIRITVIYLVQMETIRSRMSNI